MSPRIFRICSRCFAVGLTCHCMYAGIKTPPAGAISSIIVSASTSVGATGVTGPSPHEVQIVHMVTGKRTDMPAPTRAVKRGNEEVPTPPRPPDLDRKA
jgi:hypothetical protein